MVDAMALRRASRWLAGMQVKSGDAGGPGIGEGTQGHRGASAGALSRRAAHGRKNQFM